MGRPVRLFLKVCSKARNFSTLSVTDGWKRMPPLYGPIELLFCTRQPRCTRILPLSSSQQTRNEITRSGSAMRRRIWYS